MRLIIRAATAVLLACTGAGATVIYSNFGPGDSYVTDSGGPIDQQPSISFVSATDQFLSEVDFAAFLRQQGSLNQLSVSLSRDASGHPGTTIGTAESFDTLLNLTPAIYRWIPTAQLALTGGTTYWITLTAPAGNVIWNANDQGAFGISRFTNGVWTAQGDTQGALRIIGSAPSTVPEPGTWPLLTAGLGLVAVLRRSRWNPGLSRTN